MQFAQIFRLYFMSNLLIVIPMTLDEYLKNHDIDELAAKSGTSKWYLYQLRRHHRKPGLKLCERLEKATDGKVTIADLRPDWYGALQTMPIQASESP